MPISRRDVFRGLPGALASPVLLSLADAQLTPDMVKFRPEIEPLVSLIERTPRDRCAEMAVDQLGRGVSYRQLLAALFLAGIRNVNPRPPGFALHCVFVIHAAHLISLEAPPDSRLLPLFYALDDFKASQDRDAHAASGDFTMQTLRGSVPSPERAGPELIAALEAWDPERAERAVVSLARNRSAGEIFSMLWRYGARDYRNIGHKAIFTANSYRTLQVIGWQHAEPVLRSLVLALLDFGKQQINGYAFDDQCYAGNLKLVKDKFARLNDAWASGPPEEDAARGILKVIREAAPNEACADVAARLTAGGTSAASVWDAVHLASAELRMRARGGASLASIHAVTSANALHYAYLTAPDPQLRLLLLLQAVGWMGQFRTFAGARPENLRGLSIAGLEPAPEDAPLDRALRETFAGIPADPEAAAARVMRLAPDPASRRAYLATALRHTISKINEVHYYKYLAALIEDVPLVSPRWQPHLLGATVYYVKGLNDPEPPVMKRAREALRSLAV